MEGLADEVEIVFHPDPGDIDPLDSSPIRLEPIEDPQPSTSRSIPAYQFQHEFKVPEAPLRKSPVSYGLGLVHDDPTTTDQEDAEDEEDEENDTSEYEYEHEKENGDEEDDEWEEALIYVDLDDIPNVEELFAEQPDDLLLSQTRKNRVENPKHKKSTNPDVLLRFYNLDDTHPLLQIGERFYIGKYEEPFGSALFFREKSEATEPPVYIKRDPLAPDVPPRTILEPLTAEMDPPPHPVFGEHIKCNKEYELVANVHKVLKMTRRNVLYGDKQIRPPVQEVTPATHVTSTSTSDVEPLQIPKKFTPLRAVDLDIEDSTVASWRLRQRNKAFLRGLDAGEELAEDDGQEEPGVVVASRTNDDVVITGT